MAWYPGAYGGDGCGHVVVTCGPAGQLSTLSCETDVIAHFPSDGTPLLLSRRIGAHGTYYGRPYNYRNLLDYPWHPPVRQGGALEIQPIPAAVPQPLGDE
ncbi:MAG: hypothetical protein GTO53_02620 [Planctomycetales bacterium]|nr:hypothetical protein [Planctomycetales bacterium]NIM08063.1 hypothetical protein [Planctomycetales bacterium]NIO45656.1 hypothetical protein [Planctomycetales bacterium]NIP68280.1 hypothetical protein [Planctomycetales bacterium]